MEKFLQSLLRNPNIKVSKEGKTVYVSAPVGIRTWGKIDGLKREGYTVVITYTV